MNAVIYARYSSENQSEESITAQLRACRDYAARNHLIVVDEYIDRAQSARTDHRPAFQQMIADAKLHRFDVLIVHKLDRFSRDRYDHALYRRELRNANVQLRSVLEQLDDSPESVVLESVLEGFSEYYSRNLARETRKGLREIALKGLYTGGTVLYGYYVGDDQKYHINDLEAAVVRRIFDACDRQCGYNKLLDELRREGVRTRAGKIFTASSFHYILRNQRYTGDYVYSPVGDLKSKKSEPIIVKDAIPAIITRQQWQRVQRRMKSRKQCGGSRAKEPYLLSGILFCGECGAPMHGHASRKMTKSGEYIYYSYECQEKNRRKGCRKRCVPRDRIESAVLDHVREFMSQHSIARIREYLVRHAADLNLDIQNKQDELKKMAESLDRKINRTVDLLIEMPSPKLRERLSELEFQRQELENKIVDLDASKFDPGRLDDYIIDIRNMNNMSRDELKEIVQKTIKKVTVYDDGHFTGDTVISRCNWRCHPAAQYTADFSSLPLLQFAGMLQK